MIDFAMFRIPTYRAVEADASALGQAMLVVVIVAIASGVTGLGVEDEGVSGLIGGVIAGLVGWAVWAWITYFVGTTIFNTSQTHADWGQLARTTGFAQSPGVLRVFGFIPVIGWLIALVATIWQFAAMVVAVREALDYTSTWRAVGVVLIGFIIALAVVFIVLLVFAFIVALLFGAAD